MQIDVKDLIKNLERMKTNKQQIETEYQLQSLEWIKLRANYNLNSSIGVRESQKEAISNGWKIIQEGKNMVLYNETSIEAWGADQPVSIGAFIEFGIGIVGMGTYEGDEGNYEYNKSSKAKERAESEGYPDSWYYFGYMQGIEAEAFLYRAYRDYVDRGICATIYDRVVKTMNGW